MKLRTVNRIVTNTTGHGDKTLLEHANAYGYLLPMGGTPWDAETMTIRLLGLGKGALDVLAGFDPERTFETPAGPASRLPFVIHWRNPEWPVEEGREVVFADVVAGQRRGQVKIAMTEGYVWRTFSWDSGFGERIETSDGHTDALKLRERAEGLAVSLGNELCRETP